MLNPIFKKKKKKYNRIKPKNAVIVRFYVSIFIIAAVVIRAAVLIKVESRYIKVCGTKRAHAFTHRPTTKNKTVRTLQK